MLQSRIELYRSIPPLLWGKKFGFPTDLVINMKNTKFFVLVDVKKQQQKKPAVNT